MATEIVRDSSDIYLDMAEEQLEQGQISELLHQRELSIAHHNGLATCPICKAQQPRDSELCQSCEMEFSGVGIWDY